MAEASTGNLSGLANVGDYNYDDREDITVGAPNGDPASVMEPLAHLKRLLETDDGEAADFIVDTRPHLAGVLTPDEIRTLTERVGNFDFDSALKCLSGIASRLSLNLEGK